MPPAPAWTPRASTPEPGGSSRLARAVCVTCTVRDECLAHALGDEDALRRVGREDHASNWQNLPLVLPARTGGCSAVAEQAKGGWDDG
jgi:hypothetical protein